MKYSKKELMNKTVMNVSGALTLPNMAELKPVLTEALDKNSHVDIRLNAVTEVDMSFLQLLCSAHRTALDLGRNITLDSAEADLFKKTIKDAGFKRHTGCSLSSGNGCLWIGGDS